MAEKKQHGFTLIELLVVIAIIAVLMGILMPGLRKARETARMAACSSNQRQLIMGLLTYAQDNDHKLPPNPGQDGSAWHRPTDLNSSVLPKEMNGLKLNAGYLDGHVEKFNATETVHLTHNNLAHNWLTQKYR